MEKISYQAPEMEVIELKHQVALLSSSEIGGGGGNGHAPELDLSSDEE